MTQPSLFPSEVAKPEYPGEPDLWIKQLVIVPVVQSGVAPLREISFRLGLNIIDTRLSRDPESNIFGHNVGKTLLVRMIRYCLGDHYYARYRIRERIRAKFPEAHVIGIFRISGQDFGVIRSLSSPRHSYFLETAEWRELLQDPRQLKPYQEFTSKLESLKPKEFAQIQIGLNDRHPQWVDYLGWVIRDQRCRYTTHNTWRYREEDDSDVHVLNDSDANLIIRTTMKLLDRKEYQLSEQLSQERQSLKSIEKQIQDIKTEQERIAYLLAHEAGITADLGDSEMAHLKIRELIQHDRDELSAELSNSVDATKVADAERDWLDARGQRDKVTGAIEKRELDLQRVQSELELAEKSEESDKLDKQKHILGCKEYKDCKWLQKDCTLPDPTRADRIRDKKAETKRLNAELIALNAELDQKNKLVASREKAYRTDAVMFEANSSGTRQKIAFCDFLMRRLDQFVISRKDLKKLERSRTSTESTIKELESQRESRAQSRKTQLEKLNRSYQEVMFGMIRQRKGKLSLDLKSGIASNPDQAAGEALGSTGQVVGFDLTCVLASLDGIGHHPRFLVHDSPREADLSEHIYGNLFRYVLELEQRFPKQEPAFQYIVTTTTKPPKEVTKTHIRETLHDESPEGRLMGFVFE